jgi:hypothetical protein
MHGAFGSDLVVATPVVINAGWVTFLAQRSEHRTFPVVVTGIRLDEYVRVNRLGEGLYYDSHFPASTVLGPSRKPVLRRDAQGVLRLPDDLEQALAGGQGSAEPAAQARLPGQPWPGPGLFEEAADAEPAGDGYTGQPYPGLILGVGLAAQRSPRGDFERTVPRGTLCRLTVLPHTRTSPIDSALGTTQPFRYVDDSRSRIHDIDSRAVYCDFDVLQSLLELDGHPGTPYDRPRAAQIQVRMKPGTNLAKARETIERLWFDFLDRHADQLAGDDFQEMSFMRVQTWQQRNAAYITAIEKQRILVLILLGVISVVAIVLVGCTFYMIVQERTAEIGIIKSMGASRGGVAGLFLTYAAAVGVVGSILGVAVGSVFVYRINDIQDALAALHPRLRVWNPEVYSFERIPSVVHATDAAVIVGVGILAALIGSTVAAAKAARVWPVRALHHR